MLVKTSYLPKSFIAWLLLTLIALVAVNLNLQFPCLIAIKNDLKTNDFMIQLSLVLGPCLAILSNIFFGLWCDRWDRKKLLLICIFLFSSGSLICGLSANIYQFLIGRSFQILGDSGLSIIVFAILASLFTGKALGEYLGYNTIISTIFCICSPPFGVWIMKNFGWHINFILLSFLSLVLFIIFYFVIPPSSQEEASDLKSVSGLLNQYLQQIKIPSFCLASIIPALYATVASLFDFYSPIFHMDIYGLSPESFSYIRVALILVNVVASLGYVFILKKKDMGQAFKIGILSYLLYTVGIFLTLIISGYHNLYFLFILASIQSISSSFVGPICMLKAVSCFPGNEGISLSIFALARNILSTVATLIAALIFNHSLFPIILIIGLISMVLSHLLYCLRNMSDEI